MQFKPGKPKRPKKPKMTKVEEAQKGLEEAYDALFEIPSGDAIVAGATEMIETVMLDLMVLMEKMNALVEMFDEKMPEEPEPDPGV